MAEKKYLIVVGGPTASGKTSLAIELANHYKTEIISADSRQFYKELTIGTAKPAPEELSKAKHHFIGHLSIKDPYSAGQFEREASKAIKSIFEKNAVAILVGGSGLFLKAVTEGFDDLPEIASEVREEINQEYQNFGLEKLQQELQMKDPEYYKIIDIQNPRRVIRALEIIRSSGSTMSLLQSGEKKQRAFECIYIAPHWKREKLYDRINLRVDKMFASGLLEEVEGLRPHQNHQSLMTVGYRELFDYFSGNISLEEAVEMIKRNSRRYAKRQLTWLRQQGDWLFLSQPFFPAALKLIDLIQGEWHWEIQSLPSEEKMGLRGEKRSLMTLSKDENIAKLWLSKRPKNAQAFFEATADFPMEHFQLLVEQLEMRCQGIPLYIWKKSADDSVFGKNYEEQGLKGYFPFRELAIGQDSLKQFKRIS